ncbi:MAG TPA: tripartite tricarboxylate transporter substrate binding protein [Xanthobacteraceae bacterium]
MKLPRRQFLHLAARAAALSAVSGSARAQSYPTRPVHLIVGLAAGGGTDLVARIMADSLSQYFGKQFIVENRTGMAGNLATQTVVNSPPDGNTLLFTGPASTISTSLYKTLPFNFQSDTVPVAGVMRFPNLMVVPPSLPVRTVQEFIDFAKAHPGGLSMASSGVGASPHLSGELFKFMTKIEMVHVPYRGSAAVYPDLMTGAVHVLFDNLAGSIELVRAGRLRALAVTTANRWDSLPDIPAIAETVPGYEVSVWYGIVAPKGTPSPILAALNKAVAAALVDPKVVARFAELGGLPMPMTPDELGRFIADDTEKWRKVIAFAGVSAE